MAFSPLEFLSRQPSIAERTEARRELRRESELADLLHPIEKRQVELQGQEQELAVRDREFQRMGQAANVFLGGLGEVEGLSDEERNQKWQSARGQAMQAGFDLGQVPEQYSPEWHGMAQRMAQQFGGASAADRGKLGAQKILPDGTIVQSTSKGPVVYGPDGQRLKGQDAADAVRKAQQFGADLQGKRSKSRTLGSLEGQVELGGKAEGTKQASKQAVDLSGEAFKKLAPIRRSIANMNEAISLIDQGAETGVIASRLPSVKEASVKLDNLQQQMGLDVIANTTFGALSGPELRFALDSALPKNLEGAELKQWLADKRDAQEKLASYLSETAEYLGRPGNTVAGWLELQRNKRQESAQPATQQPVAQQQPQGVTNALQAQQAGWELMQDANGNSAYVSPDGSQFIEVQ